MEAGDAILINGAIWHTGGCNRSGGLRRAVYLYYGYWWLRRFDVEVKSRAQGVYGIDVRVPGMIYAATKQSPTYGGALKGFSFEAIRAMPGVV